MQILADASKLGGFAGLVAAVMMIWVLRQQAACSVRLSNA